MAMDVLDHHDGVVDHEPDRQHHRQQRQQVEAEAHDQHQAADADQRQRDSDHGNNDRAERGKEQEDHDHDDQHSLDQRVLHLVDRRLNELRGIISHLHLHRRRQVAFELRKQRAHALDQRQRVALRRCLHADEDRALAAECDARVRALGGKFDGCDILDPHEAAVLGLDDHLLELLEVPQVGVGLNVRDNKIALGLTRRGLEVVGGNRRRDVARRHTAACHPHRIEPQPHCERLPAENVGRCHAVNRRQYGLDNAREVIGDRRSRELVAGETEIHHGRGLAGGLGHDRVVRFLRDQVSDRVHLGENFGQRLVRIEVQLDVDLDRAGALHRRRGDVVDAFGGGDRLLDRGGDEALDQAGRRARIDGGDIDHRVRQFRILPDRQYAGGPQTNQQDQQADDDRQDRTLDEDIG